MHNDVGIKPLFLIRYNVVLNGAHMLVLYPVSKANLLIFSRNVVIINILIFLGVNEYKSFASYSILE